MGVAPPPGLGAFLAAHDGGLLGAEVRLLTLEEAAGRIGVRRPPGSGRPGPPVSGRWSTAPAGTTPSTRRRRTATANGRSWRSPSAAWTGWAPRFFASCTFSARSWRPVGVTGEAAIALAETRSRRDPGHADHWLDLGELLEAAGREGEIDAVLTAALRAATPPTPALMLAIGMRAVQAGDEEAALRAFRDAITLEPVGARDDDARLDAAALVHVLATDRGDTAGAAARPRPSRRGDRGDGSLLARRGAGGPGSRCIVAVAVAGRGARAADRRGARAGGSGPAPAARPDAGVAGGARAAAGGARRAGGGPAGGRPRATRRPRWPRPRWRPSASRTRSSPRR